jgi:hypothetical protein
MTSRGNVRAMRGLSRAGAYHFTPDPGWLRVSRPPNTHTPAVGHAIRPDR